MGKEFHHVILGGTFDHFHAGHELFVRSAFAISQKATIGITDSCMNTNKQYSETIESYFLRLKQVKKYIFQSDFKNSISYLRIKDIFGSSLTDKSIDAIVVTQDTKKGAEIINSKRKEIQMNPLPIIVIPSLKGNDNKIISSERIRSGEIDRKGFSYKLFCLSKSVFHLPEEVRELLRKPIGKVFSNINCIKTKKPKMFFTVGDIVTQKSIDANIIPDVSIIDLKTRRKELRFQMIDGRLQSGQTKFINRAGTIEKNAVEELMKRFELSQQGKKQCLIIDGEEDLLALPAILFAPLGSIVLYGLWNRGVVQVKVTEKQKETAVLLMKKFK